MKAVHQYIDVSYRKEIVQVFSHASAKAERGLSSLSCVWMHVDQNQGTLPLEMAYPLGIP